MGLSIAVDSNGAVYTTGYFRYTADFDPGSGTYTLTCQGYNYCSFVSKLDSSGNFVWAKGMAGDGSAFGQGISVDSGKNVYTIGYFSSSVDFDPGAGTSNLTSAGFEDIFISKLNSSGDFAWAKSLGGTNHDFGAAIAVDSNSNVYTTGWYRDTADFDPGAGTFNLTSVGGYNNFVSLVRAVKMAEAASPWTRAATSIPRGTS